MLRASGVPTGVEMGPSRPPPLGEGVGPEGGGGTQVPNGYPLPNGRAERKR